MKKALIITTISGFVPQFEMNQVFLLQKLGYEVHYATNFDHPVYDYDRELFREKTESSRILFPLKKAPRASDGIFRRFCSCERLLKRERFDLIHCHNPMGGVLGRLAGSLYSSGLRSCIPLTAFIFIRELP